MGLAVRNLTRDRTRLGLSVAGVALATMLVLLLSGFLDGMNAQITSYLDHSPGSIVVAQSGIKNMLVATSVLPAGMRERVMRTDGVATAAPVLSSFVILELRGDKRSAYLVGFDPALGGGPWRLGEGRDAATDEEAVVDRALARRYDLRVGEGFDLMGRRFTIVGLSEGTTSWMTSFIFVRKSAAESLFSAPGMTSFLLVAPAAGTSEAALRERLGALQGVSAIAKDEVARNDVTVFSKVIGPPVRLMTGIAFLVGTLVVGLVLYSATIERRREYGVLKAIGASPRTLYGVTLTQALIVTVAGAALGLALAVGEAQLVMELRPQFLVTFEPRTVATGLVASALMALLAVFLPARVIAGLAPADVFRR
jgi:putative ABC transport system permease protein